MAIKVIRKNAPKIDESLLHTISFNNIIAPQAATWGLRRSAGLSVFELTESIKPTIKIKIDAYGQPSVSTVNLGIQYEHYSTWMNFNLDDLLWQIKSQYMPSDGVEYEEEYYYALYDFRVYFKHQTTGEVTSWEFDGIDFQIPWQITQTPGTYEMALVIQEKQDDEEQGNVPDDYSPFDDVSINTYENVRETFISRSWYGTVTESYFTPNLINLTNLPIADTNQTKALIKPAIDCMLADDGYFALESGVSNNMGVYNDNYVRYLRFMPGRITTHLTEFYVFAIFKQNDIIVPVVFEQTESEKYDDTTKPLIAWIPSEVFESAGEWRLMIAAISKNYMTNDVEDENYTEFFYRFLSDRITMTVDPGFISDLKLITNADEQYYASDFVTADEQVIVSDDNAILRGER